ncbi:N-acetylglucosaminidase, partial [Irregularibacter muris]
KANNSPYASEKFNLYIKGYELYPNDSRFKEGVASSAVNILNLARKYHGQGNFDTAINYYNRILTAPTVPYKIIGEANMGIGLANKKILYTGDNIYIQTTKYNLSINEMLSKQMALGKNYVDSEAYPRTDLLIYADLSKPKDKYGWYAASAEGTLYHLNPANFMDNDAIYQFLVLSVSTGILEKDLNNLLINQGILESKGAAFAMASQLHSINELYLISHAKLETGNGSSTLANGAYIDANFRLVNDKGFFINSKGALLGGKTEKEYKKVYNMFGIGAVDSDALRSGAERAYKEGWFTPEKAIIGGAKFIAEGYVHHQSYKQDTLYKMRWNPANPATHQYATDIGWAVKQARIFADLYKKCTSYTLIFDIPQFN